MTKDGHGETPHQVGKAKSPKKGGGETATYARNDTGLSECNLTGEKKRWYRQRSRGTCQDPGGP